MAANVKMTINADQIPAHSTTPEFTNRYQVVVVYDYHVTVGYPLYISCRDQVV